MPATAPHAPQTLSFYIFRIFADNLNALCLRARAYFSPPRIYSGWGGNYFVIGGGVKGKQVLGKFPNRLKGVHAEEDAGRARFVPSTPWESVWNGIAEWFGVNETGRDAILPMMKHFNKSVHIFSKSQI